MIGKTLGHFRVLEKIGAGGMGEIYRAHDEHLDRDVALKLLPHDAAFDHTSRKRFRREAHTLAKLRHAHIGAVYDFASEEDVDFLVMELIPGTDLATMLESAALPEDEVVRLGVQIAEALEEAHEQRIVHLDLKPKNVMVTPKGEAKVLDFGLSRLVRSAEEGTTASLSQMQSVAGTLPYMAPEQLQEDATLDGRTDVYALGVTLYEMVTGKRPFPQQDANKLITAILQGEPTALRARQPEVSKEFERVVSRALEKDPEHRYQTVTELKEELLRCEAGLPVLAPRRATRRRWRWVAMSAAALGVVGALTVALNLAGSRDWLTGASKKSQRVSLAVLPFTNLTGDPEQEYFVDGMTDALIGQLSRLEGLVVLGRQSLRAYNASEISPAEVAAALGVSNLVQGSVMRDGNQVRVAVQLTEATTDRVLWADNLTQDAAGVFALLSAVTSAIARGVEVALSPAEEQRLIAARTVNPEAYEAFLRGRYIVQTFDLENYGRAVDYFERAIAIDSTFAPAYAGMAEMHYYQSLAGATKETIPKARACALKALEIDSTLASAHLALAWVRAVGDWDWEGAEIAFRRAVQLDPNSPMVHEWYGIYLMNIGRFEEAMEHKKRAHELDPNWEEQGWEIVYQLQGRFEEALPRFEQMVASIPNSALAHVLLARTYGGYPFGRLKGGLGRYDEMLAELEKALELHEAPFTLGEMVCAYAQHGRIDDARRLLERLEELATRSYVSPFHRARAHLCLDHREQALSLLEQAVEDHDPALLMLYELAESPLESEPRFQAILARIKHPGI